MIICSRNDGNAFEFLWFSAPCIAGIVTAIHHIIDLSINGFTLTDTFSFTNLKRVEMIISSSRFIHGYLNITRDVDLGVVRKLECLDPGVKDHVCLFRQDRVTLLPVSNQFWHSKNQFYHEHKMVSEFKISSACHAEQE